MVEVSHFGLSVPNSVTPCIVPGCEALCSHVLQEASLVTTEQALLLEKIVIWKNLIKSDFNLLVLGIGICTLCPWAI